MSARVSLAKLNQADEPTFVAICGPFFEHSPWIAARTFATRPFASRDELHRRLVCTVAEATPDEQLALIAAHPDLVGRLAREGGLTRASASEQAAAGLDAVSPEEAGLFDQYNRVYRDRFGFPFVICARENKKAAILAAFPVRLQHTREQEIATALAEIARIARLRLLDALDEE
jgi:OHCU decarboxylase